MSPTTGAGDLLADTFLVNYRGARRDFREIHNMAKFCVLPWDRLSVTISSNVKHNYCFNIIWYGAVSWLSYTLARG